LACGWLHSLRYCGLSSVKAGDSFWLCRSGSLENLIFERHPFGVALLEPVFRCVDIREHLDVVGIADVLAGAMIHNLTERGNYV
jgi:hypothetical protein